MDKIDLSVVDDKGNSILHYVFSVFRKSVPISAEICNILIRKGIPFNVSNKIGMTPLHIAVRINDLDACQYALKQNQMFLKSDIDRFDDESMTPLHYAC
jgi:ankyrin repeat protein